MGADDALQSIETHGHGSADFIVDAAGNLVPIETQFTIKLNGKDPREAWAEWKATGQWQPGDRVCIPHFGKYDYVRITRPALDTRAV